MFDVLEAFQNAIWALYQRVNINFRYQGNIVDSKGMFDQMRSLGYNTSSSVFNLGTMLFLIISYILRLIVYAMVVNLVKVKSETMENYL